MLFASKLHSYTSRANGLVDKGDRANGLLDKANGPLDKKSRATCSRSSEESQLLF